jgi:hypothetical protein
LTQTVSKKQRRHAGNARISSLTQFVLWSIQYPPEVNVKKRQRMEQWRMQWILIVHFKQLLNIRQRSIFLFFHINMPHTHTHTITHPQTHTVDIDAYFLYNLFIHSHEIPWIFLQKSSVGARPRFEPRDIPNIIFYLLERNRYPVRSFMKPILSQSLPTNDIRFSEPEFLNV